MRPVVLAALLLAAAGPTLAQVMPTVNCASPDLPTPEVAACAAQVFDAAEAELDQTFRLALTEAQVFDEETALDGSEVTLGVEEALREAQAQWLEYREAACDAEVALMRGGTGAPAAGTVCRARLALERIEDLRAFAPEF